MTDGPHVTAVSGQSTFLVLRPLHAAMKYSLNVTATFQDGTNSQPARLNIRMPVDGQLFCLFQVLNSRFSLLLCLKIILEYYV